MRAVNLLPGAANARRRPRVRSIAPSGRLTGAAAVAGALIVLGGVGYLGYDARQDADRMSERVAEADGRRTLLLAELDDFRTEARARELQEARRGAIVALVAGRTDWERLIRDVATVVPPGVWLASLTTAAGSAPPAGDDSGAGAGAAPAPASGGAPTITVEGIGPNQSSAAAMITRLGVVPGIAGPRLVSSAFEDVEGNRMVRFIIEASVDQRAQGRAQLAPVVTDGQGAP